MNRRQQYDPKKMTIDAFKKMFSGMFEQRAPGSHVVLYTGIGGMMTWDYCMANESGVLSTHMKKHHGKFTRLLGMGLNKAVDENGIVWMIGRVKGKGYYFSNMQQRTSSKRKRDTRFIDWEAALHQSLEPMRRDWPARYPDQYQYHKEKHNERKEATRTGIRRKGTLTAEEGAIRRGY